MSGSGLGFLYCANPDTLRLGVYLHWNPDSIIVGETAIIAGQRLEQFYRIVR